MALFPMFLKLEGRPALVVGAGRVGEAKIRSLLRAGACVRVVAPVATARVRAWAGAGRIAWAARPFVADDLHDVFLAVVATPSVALNDRIAALARRRHIFVNVVDDPERCDFYYPAVVRRGPLTLAISTEGRSPAFARRLRRHLDWPGSRPRGRSPGARAAQNSFPIDRTRQAETVAASSGRGNTTWR
jgi:precorrin-2 dehydrogenase/sirohydrochlorin ferrochelatase